MLRFTDPAAVAAMEVVMRSILRSFAALLLALVPLAAGCGDADSLGVAAECSTEAPCPELDDEVTLACLTEFKGGYCGLKGCAANADCPENAICVTHGGENYCFRTCTDKTECNANRTEKNEANCSSSITRVEAGSSKACVPPSGN